MPSLYSLSFHSNRTYHRTVSRLKALHWAEGLGQYSCCGQFSPCLDAGPDSIVNSAMREKTVEKGRGTLDTAENRHGKHRSFVCHTCSRFAKEMAGYISNVGSHDSFERASWKGHQTGPAHHEHLSMVFSRRRVTFRVHIRLH